MTMIKVFSKEWFEKHNKTLCFFANSFLGNLIFGFKKMGHYTENRIVAVRPNSVVEFVGYKGLEVEVKEHFFVRNEYALRLRNVFYPIWITFHIWDIITRPLPQLNLGFDTLTAYPDADTETTSVDGAIIRLNVNESWATIRSSTGTNAYPSITSVLFGLYILTQNTTDVFGGLGRSAFLFDTSSLGSQATISSAVLSLYGESKVDSLDCEPDINIYTSNPSSNTDLVVGDFSTIGSTKQCDTAISYTNFNTSGYNDFTFNSSGIGNISKTSISKFGARNANYDVSGTAPTWIAGKSSYLAFYFADNGTNKPKLVVTYTVVTFSPQLMMCS